SKPVKRVRFAEVDEVYELQPTKLQNTNTSDKNGNDSEGSDEDEDADLLEDCKQRRGAVNLDGYGSDESKSDEEESLSWKNTLEDDDMFGEAKTDYSKKPKLVDINEFEGQENGNPDDEDNKMEPFNLKDMRKEGKFDENGNFVWNAKDKNSHHDSWLTGISKEEITKARVARERQLEREAALELQRNASRVTEEAGLDLLTPGEIKVMLINIMRPQETVLSTLSRLGGGTQNKRRVRVNKNRAKKEAQEAPQTEADAQLEAQRKRDIHKVTELAAHLIEQGQLSIYQETYESLVRSARLSNLISDDWVPGTPL
ncbi:hypothetical protein L0F63_002499, partial [Massospora cicadina]